MDRGAAGSGAGATLSRRAGLFLVGIAVWNVLTYSMFTRNLYWHGTDEPDRPTGYYVAHTVLIIVNMAIALVLAPIGWRVLQAHRARRAEAGAGSPPPAGVGADRG